MLWRFLVDPAMGPWSRMHRVMREGTPAANDKFIGSMCKTAAETGAWEAARSAEVLDKGGASALQVRGGARGEAGWAAGGRVAGGRPRTQAGCWHRTVCWAGAAAPYATVPLLCARRAASSLLQAAMGGKSAGRLIRKANSENEPQN